MSQRVVSFGICLSIAMMSMAVPISEASLDHDGKMSSAQENSESILVAFDDSIHSEGVNAMELDGSGNLIIGGIGCARDSTELNVPFTCEMAFDGGTVSTDDFVPAFISVMDTSGRRVSMDLFSSGFGDRIDAILSLSNGDILVAGGFCWQSSRTSDLCTLEGGGGCPFKE